MKIKIIIGLVLLLIVSSGAGGLWYFQQQATENIREADKFNLPVINAFMPELSKWQYQQIEPFVSKKLIKVMSEEGFQEELDNLSVLGKVVSFKPPRHVNHRRFKHRLYGVCAANKYTVSTEFEKGNGSVSVIAKHCNKKVVITFFQVHSKALPPKIPDWLKPGN